MTKKRRNRSVVLVTGAASGIGRATALLAAERGHDTVALDIDENGLTELAAETRSLGAARVHAIRCDVTDENEVASAFTRASDECGAPTRIFANAGIESSGLVDSMDLADWRRILDVNLTGVLLTCKYALRAMQDQSSDGAIVCTSSPSAFVGFAGGANSAYGASKGGVSAFVRAAALDLAPLGVRINAIVPGSTDTPLLLQDIDPKLREEARRALELDAKTQIPMGRLANPREVAYGVLWLLSEEASYVTGSHLICDGGLLAKGANDF